MVTPTDALCMLVIQLRNQKNKGVRSSRAGRKREEEQKFL